MMDYEELESAYQAKCAELEACKLELKQLRGNYAMVLNNAGQAKAKYEQRARDNQRLVQENAELKREMQAVHDAVLAIGGEWHEGGGVRIVPPGMDTVISMNTDLARDLKAAEEERDMWRDKCGRMKDAACELLRVSES